ncbi:SusC/RagA family TonB-linked outer membrane protein [Sphingobacterium sp. SGR-19]|uniref:SusC/RagA family TonB-linked outer membrane protein n=1 Tax=Sphingobacterium sp. SGR-19 TaxID=2710886 RepID=UPI0013EA8A20|nr:SusC/RagA family TonB-linked outer membrane protein [Sphingobacterium sp. SGR-19]NGM66813.1 SusC/RagA family TonB-linked outer membrane protein [Sphingobacterium sp. SGR-19]
MNYKKRRTINLKWLASLLLSIILFSSHSIGQISVKARQVDARKVMNSIEQQSNYRFVYDENSIQFPVVNVELTNASIEQALAKIFANTDIEYKIVKKNILLKNTVQPTSRVKSPNNRGDMSQRYTFTGNVENEEGIALGGASVRLKNTNIATSTDENGYFVLESETQKGIIQISFIGYEIIEVPAKIQMGTVVLPILASEISEVTVNVNTGYQTIPKERATGAFGSLPKESLEQQRLNDLNTLLEGRIAGYHDGRIRGTTSMNGVTSPLFVVDGFPIETSAIQFNGNIEEALPNLNLEDIESITVLRDAAAASIYGARAANGVVVIVTKKGKAQGTEVNASAVVTHTPYYYNTSRITSAADIIGIEREWAMRNPQLDTLSAAGANSWLNQMIYPTRGIQTILQRYAGKISESEMNSLLDEMASSGYRYFDDVERYGKRNPFAQQYNVNIANGSEKNRFYASATYKKNLLEDIYSKNGNLGINLRNTTQITKWLSVELSSFLTYGSANQQTYDLLDPKFTYMPYDGLKNVDGSNYISTEELRLSQDMRDKIRTNNLYNMDIDPLNEMANNIQQEKRFGNRSYIKLNVDFADWISYTGSFQYEFNRNKGETLYDKNSFYVRNRVNSFARGPRGQVEYPIPYGHIFATNEQNNNSYIFRQQVNVNKSFGEDHSLHAIAGTEIRESHFTRTNQTLHHYDPVALTYEMLSPGISSGGGILGTYAQFDQRSDVYGIFDQVRRYVSLYANAGYAYRDTYLLSGSIRYDRSNLWGTSSKYQNKPIWSLGAGWNVDREDFFDVDWIDQLKIRTSYGIGGNIAQDVSPYLTTYYNLNPNVGGMSGSVSSRPNPLLSWEKTTTINIGTDFRILNNRITGSIDYYQKKGEDLLASAQGIPTEGFGYSTYDLNNGGMTNHGIETTLGATVFRKDKFSWNTNLLHAYNKNKVTYVDVEAPVYFLQIDYPNAFPRIGNPYQAIYGYAWAGLNADGMPQVYNESGEKLTSTPSTLESVVYAGSTVPTHTFSWTNSLTYKNFDFSVMMTYQTGHKIRNADLPYLGGTSRFANIRMINKDIAHRWMEPGDEANTDIPRLVFPEEEGLYNAQSENIYRNADVNVLDARNLNIRNVSLAYRIPSGYLEKFHIPGARIQINAEHVALVAKSKNAKNMLGGYRRPNYVFGLYLTL